jgi:tetratricopeptide (TPR) repeat protein
MGQREMPSNLSRLKDFYEQAPHLAVEYRLPLLRQQMRNYEFLEHDLETIWQAIERCYQQQDWEQLVAFREALQPFLDLRGFWNHSLTLNTWANKAAEALGDIVNQARWMHDRADILNQQGHYKDAEQLYLQSEQLYQSRGLSEWALKSRHMRSMVVRAQGRITEAQYLCQTTVDEARKLGLTQWLVHPLYVLALFARDRGNIQQAEALVEEICTQLEGTDEEAMIAQCHNFLAEIALQQKKLAQAQMHLDMSLILVQRVGIKRLEMTTRRLLGDLATAKGHYEEAERIYKENLTLFDTDQLDDNPGKAQMLFARARLMIQIQKRQEAVPMLEASLALFKDVGNVRRMVNVSLLLIKVYIWQRHWRQALLLVPPTFRAARASNLLSLRRLRALLRMQSM